MDDSSLLCRVELVLTAEIDGEVVMMGIDQGRYFGLDDIGSDIWRRLETPVTLGDLVDALAAEYDAERTVIARDVVALLDQFLDHGIVRIVTG